MKTKILSLLILVLSILSQNMYAQTGNNNLDTLLAYYPFQTGNRWVYQELYFNSGPITPIPESSSRMWAMEIGKDTLMPNNKIYKQIITFSYGGEYIIESKDSLIFSFDKHKMKKMNRNDDLILYSYSYERIDSLNAKIFVYDEYADSQNIKLDFSIDPGDTVWYGYKGLTLEDRGDTNYFNYTFHSRENIVLGMTVGVAESYLKNIGLYEYDLGGDYGFYYSSLKGCVINGVLYGDTTVITSVAKNDDVIPAGYKLSQNYPNPFNAGATIISFTIPVSEFVSLKVYDILGREITTLVNEHLSIGEHKTYFFTSALPSGIYFYTLHAGKYSKTKKMIYMK